MTATAPIVIRAQVGSGEGPRPYLVLEYFEAPTLAEHIARHGPLSPAEWFEVCWPLARALQAIHGRGVLHRHT